MKKIISILVVAFIALLSIGNVSAMGNLFESDTLSINGKEIGTWKQIFSYPQEKNNIIYFGANKGDEWKYYKYENSKLIEIQGKDIYHKNMSKGNYDIIEKNSNQKFETTKNKYGEDIITCKITVNGKEYGPYEEGNGYTGCDTSAVGKNSFLFTHKNNNHTKNYIKLFTYFDTEEQKIKKEIKPIPKIDKVLNKFFAKIDKNGVLKANIVYKKIIIKIDSIISKNKSFKNKELLEYIKVKFEEKIK